MKIILLALLFISNGCFAQIDLNLGLRAYFPFTGNANDVSGNNNNPVFNNATLTADRFGNPNSAYHFNGTNTFMRIANSPSLNMNDKLSISLWVKPTGWYTGQCYNNMMLIKGDGDAASGRYSSRFSDVFNGCGPNPSTNEERFFDGFGNAATLPIVELNKWYSVVITFDGTNSKIYVNCVLQGTVAINRNFTNADDLFIGKLNNTTFPYWLNGDLDEIRIYDRALTVDEVNVLGGCIQQPCSNWLRTPTAGSNAKIGDLDVSGNQVTVEAMFNRTSAYTGSYLFAGDIVSKHGSTADINYLLRPGSAEITTTNGYFLTPEVCRIELNKTYHVALVYNGSSLKFYRNGFLMSQVPASGNLILNNFITTLGDNAANNPAGSNFVGYINEVRIWNSARSQSEIRAYMDTTLPNPTTQSGLLAYYSFNNLLNKQGNASWNGAVNGIASINNVNPNCTFIADSSLVVNAGNDSSYCSNSTVVHQLQATGTGSFSWSPAAYLNNPNIQNPIATITATTKFYVTITNSTGCSAIDSVTITVNTPSTPGITISTTKQSICSNTPAVFTAIAINGGTAPVFQWQKNGITVGSNSNIYTDTNLSDGDVIKCLLKSSLSCVTNINAESNSIVMTVNTAPANIRYPTVSTLIGQPLQLQARNLGGSVYSWVPSNYLSNPAIINPVFISGKEQEYRIHITTNTGCQVIDTQLVKISGKKGIYVPKAFSPNGDGTNDRLYPILVGITKLNYFRVFNRWGNLVFETNSSNPSAGWDGKIFGHPQPVETYTWTAEGIDIDGIIIRKSGNTFLIR